MTVIEQETLSMLKRACSAYIDSQKYTDINWEQRRYETAKDLFVAFMSKSTSQDASYVADRAVSCANELIRALKKK